MSTDPEKNYTKAIESYDNFYQEKLHVGKEYEEQQELLTDAEKLRDINGQDEYKKETFENERNNLETQIAKETDSKAKGLLNRRKNFVNKLENEVRIYGFDHVIHDKTNKIVKLKQDYPWLKDENESVKLRSKKEFDKKDRDGLMEIEASNEYFETKMKEKLKKLEEIKKEHSSLFYRDREKAEHIFNNKFKNSVFDSLDLIFEKMTKDNSILEDAQKKHSEFMNRLATLTPKEKKEFNNLEIKIFALQKARELYSKYLFVDLANYALDSFKDDWDTNQTTGLDSQRPDISSPDAPPEPQPTNTQEIDSSPDNPPVSQPVDTQTPNISPTPQSQSTPTPNVPQSSSEHDIRDLTPSYKKKIYRIISAVVAGSGGAITATGAIAATGAIPAVGSIIIPFTGLAVVLLGVAAIQKSKGEDPTIPFLTKFIKKKISKLEQDIALLANTNPLKAEKSEELRRRKEQEKMMKEYAKPILKGFGTGLILGSIGGIAAEPTFGILTGTIWSGVAATKDEAVNTFKERKQEQKRNERVNLREGLGFTPEMIEDLKNDGYINRDSEVLLLTEKEGGKIGKLHGQYHNLIMQAVTIENLNKNLYSQGIKEITDTYNRNRNEDIDIEALANRVIVASRPSTS